MQKVLIIEDDLKIAELLKRFLKDHYDAVHFTLPSASLKYLKDNSVSVIILDLNLPEMDGLELCQKLHAISPAPIIVSSARTGIEDRLFALENGADDYLQKPYDSRELLARLNILSKRARKTSTQSSVFSVDSKMQIVTYKKRSIELTLSEFEIFKLLFKNPNQIISRTDIANSISKHRFNSGVESINVLIGRIRKKIEPDLQNPIYIQTVRGVGYRFSDEFSNI